MHSCGKNACIDKNVDLAMQESCGLETFPCASLFTRSLAVENFRGKGAMPRLLCDVGIVQLSEAADCRQEQVPQPFLPGFHLEVQMD